jgi:hypothetical protein
MARPGSLSSTGAGRRPRRRLRQCRGRAPDSGRMGRLPGGQRRDHRLHGSEREGRHAGKHRGGEANQAVHRDRIGAATQSRSRAGQRPVVGASPGDGAPSPALFPSAGGPPIEEREILAQAGQRQPHRAWGQRDVFAITASDPARPASLARRGRRGSGNETDMRTKKQADPGNPGGFVTSAARNFLMSLTASASPEADLSRGPAW